MIVPILKAWSCFHLFFFGDMLIISRIKTDSNNFPFCFDISAKKAWSHLFADN